MRRVALLVLSAALLTAGCGASNVSRGLPVAGTVTAGVTTPGTVPGAAGTGAPAATAPAAAPDAVASSNGWSLLSIDTKDDGIGDFGGIARVRNDTGKDVSAVVLTVTLLNGTTVVAALQGSAQGVATGQVNTMTMVSQSPFTSGTFTAELQVDASY